MSTTVTTKTGKYEAVRTGTVKVGRWTYPVIERPDGVVVRNEKTDGSLGYNRDGFDVEAVVWDAPAATEAPKLSPAARELAAAIVNRHFDFFDDGYDVEGSGIWFNHMSEQTPNPAAARKAARELEKRGLVHISEPQDPDTKDRWLSLTAEGAAFVGSLKGQSYNLAVLGQAKAGHASGGGNQTKKPGKSTWKVGDKCPQGHKLTNENLYVMPSGRSQCRDCRKGMPSRSAK